MKKAVKFVTKADTSLFFYLSPSGAMTKGEKGRKTFNSEWEAISAGKNYLSARNLDHVYNVEAEEA